MLDFFEDQKNKIAEFLVGYRPQYPERFRSLLRERGEDIRERLTDFALRGKMIRGGLVGLGHLIYGGDSSEAVVQAGAAMELFQSGLLIHDDIMDQDPRRRGGDSVHFQYQKLAEKKGAAQPRHVGESMGICAGDVAVFLGFRILSRMPAGDDKRGRILRLCADELTLVGIAQLIDVQFGSCGEDVGPREVTDLYRYKTGRYSLSLPLMCGALLADCPERQIPLLEEFGEILGVIFQIRDDDLGLFGDEDHIGKPVGSDLKQGKKTLGIVRLLESVPDRERARIRSILDKEKITARDIGRIRGLIRDYGIDAKINGVVDGLLVEINSLLEGISFSTERSRDILEAFIRYNCERGR
ncbi:MAG: polyprenyl synthetase family protein [Candidatus Aminicenantes bacterium]|nr:polyprenyl synthetase family protein [Candidatus Aminicenantes bacterium]